jgi:uncharacterized lipoprotein YmbA
MMSALRALALLAALCSLAGCQSSPATRYFTLSEVAPASARPGTPSAGLALQVERVTIPGELDRLEIARHGESNQLRIATFELWAAPLDGMIRRIVSEDLAARLAPGSVASANEPVGDQQRRLYLDIQDFAGNERGTVNLRTAWLLKAPDGAESRGVEAVSADANDASADALAAAMSRALGLLADRLSVMLSAQPGTKSE